MPPRGRSCGIVINEPSPRSSSRLVKPKLEPGTVLASVKKEPSWTAPGEYVESALKASADGDPEEFPGLTFASQAIFNDVPPASLEDALAWSAREYQKEQRELLHAAHCQVHEEQRIIVLDDSEEDEDTAGPRHRGDSGAGCSSAAPKQDPDDDDGGDYT